MQWILASASPRRKQLFGTLVDDFEIIPAQGEEKAEGKRAPSVLAQTLASQKAREVAALPQAAGKAVLGADTVVALDGEIMGKPKDAADAVRMLTALSGRVHEVYTGICILYPLDEERRKRREISVCTKVYFNELTKEQIDSYVATGSPMDKAGAYGIQDGGLVQKIEGSFTNVVGLPVEACKELMEKMRRHCEKAREEENADVETFD